MIGPGVPSGASNAIQATAVKPGTVSAIVGTLGKFGNRFGEPTARTLTDPAWAFAAVGDHLQPDAGALLQQFAGQMREPNDTGRDEYWWQQAADD